MIRKELTNMREHDYNLIVWDDSKVIYNNLCIGHKIKRRKDADIILKKIKRKK